MTAQTGRACRWVAGTMLVVLSASLAAAQPAAPPPASAATAPPTPIVDANGQPIVKSAAELAAENGQPATEIIP
ncbi:MAG TPA: hypothetical protein VN932_00005, partial [Rhizomicrobium sp.]|nr:hypothetical protein [Rhizomicrobium sp.]